VDENCAEWPRTATRGARRLPDPDHRKHTHPRQHWLSQPV